MGKSKATVFLYLIGFFVVREISALPDFKNLVDEKRQGSKCHDIFSGFPKFSGDMSEYMVRLEAILRNSANKANKRLAIESLGKIGVVQADFSLRILRILTDAFQNREQEDAEDNQIIKEAAINTATELVLNLPPGESNSELINHLIVFVRRTDNDYLLFTAVHSLQRLTQKYPQKAFSTIESILRIFAVKFKENRHQTSKSSEEPSKEWPGESRKKYLHKEVEDAIKKCAEIALQSPPAVHEKIVEFLKDIIQTDGYSKSLKNMASKIYKGFALENLDNI